MVIKGLIKFLDTKKLLKPPKREDKFQKFEKNNYLLFAYLSMTLENRNAALIDLYV
jgi:hypothetical protein